MSALIKMLRDGWRRFCRAERGNVVITFGLAFIPIVGLTGAAVDYSRASMVRTAMQAAADSTALSVSQTAANQTSAQLQTAASAYFLAIFAKPDARNVAVTATYSNTNGSTVTVNATATVYTDFMGIMGIRQMPLAVTSSTAWGNTRLRVALVLDNTGSMADNGKMTALQTAAKNLLNQLKSAAVNNGDVYVSIIPFARYVNVDPVNYSAAWIKWSGSTDTWDENHGSCSKSNSRTTYSTKSDCSDANGTWTPLAHNASNWDGSIQDRDQNYDVVSTAPSSGTPGTLFPADQSTSNDPTPVPLMGLTYDWTALTSKISAMTPNGGTNQPIGILWGWMSLMPGAPLSAPAEDSKYQYSHVLIILSDGLNTEDRWYGNGSSHSSSVDGRQSTLCTNMKNAGVNVYAIQVNTDNAATSSVLQGCASPAPNGGFFLLTSANQIVTTFQQIGTNISRLRVAK